jgi:superfamily I DNA/RNA helicase
LRLDARQKRNGDYDDGDDEPCFSAKARVKAVQMGFTKTRTGRRVWRVRSILRSTKTSQGAAKKAGMPFKVLDENVETTSGHISIGTMHLAKGLEFRAVAVMACDDEIIPLQQRIETVGDDADLQEVYDTERHLLYVTRARDHLLITSVEPASEFLDDLRQGRALRQQ